MIAAILATLPLVQTNDLVGKTAPEFIGKQWINAEKPLSMAERKGKVTLVYFWTFACYNCKNNLPAVQRLTDDFKKSGVVTISIHTPEIKEERDVANVKKAVEKYNIKYPVLIDGEYLNWKAWGTDMWPCLYVLDKHNKLRGGWKGELNYGGQLGESQIADLITKLLKEK